eukprot:36777-Pelagomonas_calceolata.AAC.2
MQTLAHTCLVISASAVMAECPPHLLHCNSHKFTTMRAHSCPHLLLYLGTIATAEMATCPPRLLAAVGCPAFERLRLMRHEGGAAERCGAAELDAAGARACVRVCVRMCV